MKGTIIQVAKQGSVKLSEVVTTFKKSNNLDAIKQMVERSEDRVYLSWASVDAVDKDQENIPMDDLIEQQEILLKRGGPITDNHTNAVIGRTMAFKVMTHPGTGKTGILHLNKIHDDSSLDNKVWKEIVEGKRTGSSVGGFTDEEAKTAVKDGQMSTELLGFNQFETASVYSPANQHALNEAVSQIAKSSKTVTENATFHIVGNKGEILKLHVENLGKAFNIVDGPPVEKGFECLFDNLRETFPELTREEFDRALQAAYPEGVPEKLSKGLPKLKNNEDSILTENKKEGDTMTAKNKQDILKLALEKLDAGEPLTDEERSTLKTSVKTEDEDKPKEPEKKPEPEDKAEGQNTGSESPPDQKPDDENELDVVKNMMLAQQKAIDALTKAVVGKQKADDEDEDDEDKKSKSEDVAKSAKRTVKTKRPFAGAENKVAKAEEIRNIAKNIAYGQPVNINGVAKRATWQDAEKLYKQAHDMEFGK